MVAQKHYIVFNLLLSPCKAAWMSFMVSGLSFLASSLAGPAALRTFSKCKTFLMSSADSTPPPAFSSISISVTNCSRLSGERMIDEIKRFPHFSLGHLLPFKGTFEMDFL